MNTDASGSRGVSGRGKWMALVAAVLGWLFDGFEIGMFPLAGRPALTELLGNDKAAVDQWFGVITAVFLVGAASGGVFFGWLGDRMGRVRAMSLSIFTYAIFTGLCGFADAAWQIAALRFVASLGMGGEWSLGVALVNEVWPARSRAFLAGLIGSAANMGMVLVPLLSLWLATFASGAPASPSPEASAGLMDMLLRNHAWRLLMIAGAAPALLVFFVMLCVPESAKWEEERRKGATSHWATIDLLGTLLGMFAVCGVIVVWSPIAESWFPMMKGVAIKAAADPGGMPAGLPIGVPKPMGLIVLRAVVTSAGLVVALWGFLFPVQMYLRRAIEAGAVSREERRTIMGRLLLGAGLSGVALLGTWGSLQWAAKWAGELTKANPKLHAPEYTQLSLAMGAVVATILAALTADKIGRRPTYMLLCFGSIASLVWFYQGNASYGPQFLAAAFVAGGVTAAFYGWFPLYLPELFRTSIRATSQGFAYNFGRVLAAIGTLQTAQVMGLFGGSFPKAGTALSAIYLVGAALVWLGPETKGRPLPE